jgi:hypothetical protein
MIKKRTNAFQRIAGWGSPARFAATDAGVKNRHMTVELTGQAGLRQDMKIEKMVRDAKLLQIYEGTNQWSIWCWAVWPGTPWSRLGSANRDRRLFLVKNKPLTDQQTIEQYQAERGFIF